MTAVPRLAVVSDPARPAGPETRALRFGAFELDLRREELRRSGVLVKLQAQPLKVLRLLAERRGGLVGRDELRDLLWGADSHVDFEQGINVCVRQIRQVLGDQAAAPRFVETVPRRGYRFVAPVVAVVPLVPQAPPAPAEARPAAVAPTAAPGPARRAPRSRWWAAAAVAAVGIGGVGLGVWRAEPPQPRPAAAPNVSGSGRAPVAPAVTAAVPRLVVLPFVAAGGWSEGRHLADGLTEELIVELVRSYGGRLGVIASTTANRYRDTDLGVAEIAAELGVDWVVEGSLRRDGGRVRVSAQLVGADDLHRWANEYDRDLGRTRLADLDLQSTVSERIARGVALSLGVAGPMTAPARAGSAASATTPVASARVAAAHAEYLDGLGWLHRPEGADPDRALAAFRRAVGLDPGFAVGWLGLAEAVAAGGSFEETAVDGGSDPREVSREALERALALDESLPDAHRRLALIRFYRDWDIEGARREWERSLSLAPHFSEAHHDFAAYWSVTGRHDRALAEVGRALDFDPRSPAVTSDLGWYAYFAGRPGEAVERCRKTLATDPDSFWAEECILVAALAAGDVGAARDQAVANLATARRAPPPEVRAAVTGAADPAQGLDAYLRWDAERMEELAGAGRTLALQQAAVRRMMLGDGEAALVWLERAADRRAGWILPFLPVHPLFDPLRGDPRFEELVRRISGGEGLALSRARRG